MALDKADSGHLKMVHKIIKSCLGAIEIIAFQTLPNNHACKFGIFVRQVTTPTFFAPREPTL